MIHKNTEWRKLFVEASVRHNNIDIIKFHLTFCQIRQTPRITLDRMDENDDNNHQHK